ncbi:MAG: C40 family peptidase [Bacilli bacterium]|nr:C40 family peptidase [Bacilli bacterium]
MNTLNNKQKILLLSIIICIFNIFVFTISFYYLFSNNNKDIITYKDEIFNISFNKKIYYVGINETIDININNPDNINYSLITDNSNLISIDGNKITGLKSGKTNLVIVLPNSKVITSIIYIVKGLVASPQEFNYNKPYLSCNYFSNDENKLIDNTLKDRINDVGYKTRAAVIEAARFLTLNFDFRIHYFYENGRLNNFSGKEYVDGEGRYYHKGLFLSESKFDSLVASLYGPTSWGCPLTNITKAHGYGYYVGKKYPNGLDCSGFVSWALYNAGFDVKDTGAGDSPRNDDLYDLGEKNIITDELLNSKKVKVGDLIAYNGHMAIIVGIDKEHYYVSETLPGLKGLVTKKYTKEKLKNTFTHIMLMDSVYKKDGNLTNMWY